MGAEQSTGQGSPPSRPPSSYPSGVYAQPYPAYGQEHPPVGYAYHAHEQDPPVAQPYRPYSQNGHSSSFQSQQGGSGDPGRFQRLYSRIADNYNSLEEVSSALARAGLESSNLIVGIDFTKSNEWTGKISFQRRSLHHIGDYQNPYEQAISIIGKTLSSFDEDNLIPCFGFGDASTNDRDVFNFYPDGKPCRGFEDVLSRYRELVPHVRLSGPTSFGPIIDMAMSIVEKSGGQYHVLLIIADGQVTRSIDLEPGRYSTQEQGTYNAIVQASHYPLSIVLVGVGDGPWDMMKNFDDNIPSRVFDNFQFVNFTEIMSRNVPKLKKETEFALKALMEVPMQYKATLELGLLGHRTGNCTERVPLPPPAGIHGSLSGVRGNFLTTSFQESAPPHKSPFASHGSFSVGQGNFQTSNFQKSAPSYSSSQGVSPSAPSAEEDIEVCPICFINPRDMALGCGHRTCRVCGQLVNDCPICRRTIETRIRLY